jgi:hypothetical protein
VTSDNNKQTAQANNHDERSDEITASAAADSGETANIADAKIQAHRKQHQRQKAKLLGGAAIALVIILIAVVGKHLLTGEDDGLLGNSEAVVTNEPVLSDSEIALYREQIKKGIAQYEINVQPSIDEIILANWEPARVGELALLKEQGLTAFAQGAFMQAKSILETLESKSSTLITDWKNEIDKHVANAEAAFTKEQIPQAQLSLNKALAL